MKKKALNASSRFKHSFKKKNRRKSKNRVISVSIEDVRNIEELHAVDAFHQSLILDELLPAKHDDYHMMLRQVYFFSSMSWHCMSIILQNSQVFFYESSEQYIATFIPIDPSKPLIVLFPVKILSLLL